MRSRRYWLLLGIYCGACHSEPAEEAEAEAKVKVHCVRPTRETVAETLELRGQLEPPLGGDLPVASQVAGRLVEVSVREGQAVRADEVIALVDDAASRGGLRQAEAGLAQARAAERNAQATLERTRTLVARGIAAHQELDDAVARAETEQQATAAAEAALELARRTFGRVQVRAPFAGIVTRIWRGPGALVDASAATPIVQVAAAAGVEFVADATEWQLGRVSVAKGAEVKLNSSDQVLHGKVSSRSTSLDPLSGLGVVRIALDAPAVGLLLGSHGRVTVRIEERAGVLTLPNQALRGAVADGAEVVLCSAEGASIRAIRVGYRDAQRFEVTAGLSAEDRVALDHVLGLETGTQLVEVP